MATPSIAVITEEDNMDGGGRRRKPKKTSHWDVLREKINCSLTETKTTAKKDIIRLIGLLVIIIGCMVCIALKIETTLFISTFSLLVGYLLESPLSNTRGAATNNGNRG